MKRFVLSYVLRCGTTWDLFETDNMIELWRRMQLEKSLVRVERRYVVTDRQAREG